MPVNGGARRLWARSYGVAAPRGRRGGDSGFRVFGYSGSGAVARPHHVSERGAVARPHHVSERGAVVWPRHVAAGEEQGFVVFQKQALHETKTGASPDARPCTCTYVRV